MKAQDLINWAEISRLLSGARTNIRRNRIPEKYNKQVTSLINCIENWQAEINNSATRDKS
jgi:hypothetical protein